MHNRSIDRNIYIYVNTITGTPTIHLNTDSHTRTHAHIKLAKERSRSYPAKTITDVDYADDIAVLANTSAQAETLLHSLERAAGSIGFHVNTYEHWEFLNFEHLKTETICSGLFRFALDTYRIELSVKQGYIRYHFLSFGETRLGIEPGLRDHWRTLYP